MKQTWSADWLVQISLDALVDVVCSKIAVCFVFYNLKILIIHLNLFKCLMHYQWYSELIIVTLILLSMYCGALWCEFSVQIFYFIFLFDDVVFCCCRIANVANTRLFSDKRPRNSDCFKNEQQWTCSLFLIFIKVGFSYLGIIISFIFYTSSI